MPELNDRARRLELELPIEIRGQDSAGADFAETGVTVNISSSAVCFQAQRRHEVGGAVELEIALPVSLRHHFGGRETYRSRGVVYRVERAGMGWRSVVRFVKPDAPEA